ncbi:tetratricopeptide repeat protein, partial [Pseudomonas aeruginosa]
TQQLQEETGVWARMARHFPLSVKERMQWAETHWNLFDPRQAWKVLAGVDTRAIREPEFWRLRAALAWALEQDDDARAARRRQNYPRRRGPSRPGSACNRFSNTPSSCRK